MKPPNKYISLVYIFIVNIIVFFGYSAIPRKDIINLWLDYCAFKQAEEATSLVELYYAVPFNNLTFAKAKNQFKGEFDIEILIYDEKDKLVINRGWTQDFLVNNLAETRSTKEYIGKATLDFRPGAYKLVAVIYDRNSLIKTQAQLKLAVEEFGKSPLEISDLKLSKQVNSSIIPNPKLIFEDDLYLSYEIYFDQKDTLETTDEIEFEYTIYEVNGQKVNISKQTKTKLEETVKVDDEIFDLFDLPDGPYILKVNVRADSFNASKEKKFRIKKPVYKYSLGSNFEEELHLLKYVAKKKQLKEFKKLKEKGASERASYLEQFWKQKDLTPHTSRNELFEEFSRRVRFAAENFSTLKEKGWQTDRGHVYILLGDPYIFRDLPFEQEQKPRQVWTYGRYGDLIFEDEWHTGEYRLLEGWDRLPRKFVYK